MYRASQMSRRDETRRDETRRCALTSATRAVASDASMHFHCTLHLSLTFTTQDCWAAVFLSNAMFLFLCQRTFIRNVRLFHLSSRDPSLLSCRLPPVCTIRLQEVSSGTHVPLSDLVTLFFFAGIVWCLSCASAGAGGLHFQGTFAHQNHEVLQVSYQSHTEHHLIFFTARSLPHALGDRSDDWVTEVMFFEVLATAASTLSTSAFFFSSCLSRAAVKLR